MAESITITEEDTGPTAPVAEDNLSERPEWLPEKFNSAEDMAKSYSELEKKMSAPKEEAAETETPKSEPVSFTKFADEYAEAGELTADSFTEL